MVLDLFRRLHVAPSSPSPTPLRCSEPSSCGRRSASTRPSPWSWGLVVDHAATRHVNELYVLGVLSFALEVVLVPSRRRRLWPSSRRGIFVPKNQDGDDITNGFLVSSQLTKVLRDGQPAFSNHRLRGGDSLHTDSPGRIPVKSSRCSFHIWFEKSFTRNSSLYMRNARNRYSSL